jgi:hypothetical protein
MTPKDLAPNLYQIARRKERSVDIELQNLKWIRNIREIDSTPLLEEFTLLFMALSIVELRDNEDSIRWKWTIDGQYMVASAYECQFKDQ